MYNRLIVFLLRKKFGLKKFQHFKFKNQRSEVNSYAFTDTDLIKFDIENCEIRPSNVKLNWLLSDECKIIKEV